MMMAAAAAVTAAAAGGITATKTMTTTTAANNNITTTNTPTKTTIITPTPHPSPFFYHFPPSQNVMFDRLNCYRNDGGGINNNNNNSRKKDNDNNNNGYYDAANDDEDDNNDDFFQTYLKGYVKDSSLAPVLFVIDFDNTLAVYDEMYVLSDNSTNKLPSTYTRPFMYEFLDFIKSVNTNNVIVMWTAGTDMYIKQNLLLLNIAQYFDNVLSRNHCDESQKNYNGKIKSHEYLISRFPKYKRMRSILIDNWGYKNGSDTGYSEIISVKPYTLFDVAKTFGAFGVPLSNVEDVELFFTSKGVEGMIKENEKKNNIWDEKKKRKNVWWCASCNNNNNNSSISSKRYRGGDTTLLNLIIHLQNKFFNIYDAQKIVHYDYGHPPHNNNNNNNNNNSNIKTQILNVRNNYFSIAEINFV